MKTKTFLTVALISYLFMQNIQAQPAPAMSYCEEDYHPTTATENEKSYKIIFQHTSADTLTHKALMKQLGNITSVAPQTKIEVVCHGPGLDMLVKDKSKVLAQIEAFAAKGVVFSACEFSMKERSVEKSSITLSAGFVKAGILHIVSRQDEGWFYIKSGF
jgi:intracellular sulfur oxidation DsrE/DsrF family protein